MELSYSCTFRPWPVSDNFITEAALGYMAVRHRDFSHVKSASDYEN